MRTRSGKIVEGRVAWPEPTAYRDNSECNNAASHCDQEKNSECSTSVSEVARKPWRKILYEKQDYPDNYSGAEFLLELRTNVTARTYSFRESFCGSLLVMNQISIVLLTLTVPMYAYVYVEMIDWKQLLCLCAISSTFLYGLLLHYTLAGGKIGGHFSVVKTQLETLLVFLAFGYGLSPIFRTLTDTISTDTIYAMTAGMFLMHLAFHDYGMDAFLVSESMSLNAALFAVVCLISRLPTSNHAFALLASAVELFAFFPNVRNVVKKHWHNFRVWHAVFLWPCVIAALYHLAPSAAMVYGVAAVFVCGICPLLLVTLQSWKSTIHGPWDEAVPKYPAT